MRVALFLACLAGATASPANPLFEVVAAYEQTQFNRVGNGGTAVGFGGGGFDVAWSRDMGRVRIPTSDGTTVPGSVKVQGVNGSGVAVGYQDWDVPGKPTYRNAFVWDAVNGTRLIGDFGPYQSEAYGISDAGHIVGRYYGAVSAVPWMWRPGTGQEDLELLPGWTGGDAEFVNSSGLAVGTAYSATLPRTRVAWDPDGKIRVLAPAPGWRDFSVADLNEGGYMTGLSEDTVSQAFLRDPDGNYTVIQNPFNPAAWTWGVGLNNNNEMVGRFNGGNQQNRGFYWTAASGLLVIDHHLAPGSEGWEIVMAQDISDDGLVVGLGRKDEILYGVVLQVVPEPSLALAPLAVLALARRRSRRGQA